MSLNQSAKETLKIAAGSLILAGIMYAVFAITGHFSASVVSGGLLGVFAAVLNFALLALTLELSLGKGAARAQGIMGVSYVVRLFIIGAVVVFAIKSPHMNYIAAVIPLVFPRVVIMILNLLHKVKKEEACCERTEDTI